jgi:hypothetical protein
MLRARDAIAKMGCHANIVRRLSFVLLKLCIPDTPLWEI